MLKTMTTYLFISATLLLSLTNCKDKGGRSQIPDNNSPDAGATGETGETGESGETGKSGETGIFQMSVSSKLSPRICYPPIKTLIIDGPVRFFKKVKYRSSAIYLSKTGTF